MRFVIHDDVVVSLRRVTHVIKRHYCQNDRFWVAHVNVDGGIYDCEFERGLWGFPDREYPYREGEKTWADLLIADFERD